LAPRPILCRILFTLDLEGRLRIFAASDRDLSRLHRFWNLPPQLDGKQAVLEASAFHAHMIGKFEATIEGTSCDAAVKIFALTCFLRLLGFHDQDITLLHDFKIFRSEARDRHPNAIAVLTALDDIVRRPGFDGLQTLGVCQKIEDPVEADAGPEQGCEVEFVSHDQNLRKASWSKGADSVGSAL